MNEKLFKQYLEYEIKEDVPKYVKSRIIQRHGLSKKAARAFKKTGAYRAEYEEALADEIKRYAFEAAAADSSITERYEKLEPLALEIIEAGQRPNFSNIKLQYTRLKERQEVTAAIGPLMDQLMTTVRRNIDQKLQSRVIRVQINTFQFEELSERNVDDFIENVTRDPLLFIQKLCTRNIGNRQYCRELIGRVFDPETILPGESRSESAKKVYRVLTDMNGWFEKELRKTYSARRVINLVLMGSRYRNIRQIYESNVRIYNNIVEAIPDRIENLFPATRKMSRHFILHVGPTNSGKTHDAMEALKRSGDGVYLAPLRLLAYEQYERMNDSWYPCSMLTGEEIIPNEGATFTACTIEMCSFEQEYSCAVIDEAQMVADKFRGGAWSSAILGVMAGEVHVCTAPEAEQILVRMIEMCGDSYETVRHERMTPLEFEKGTFSFNRDIRPHDACIVFSRKQVHNYAAELQRRGRKVSIIYGNLPYDVRHEEARKFAEGENDFLVSTDAVDMGMNLPIERIVFLETEKFDGESVRPLKDAEIKQIAGRAGRYGVFNTGYVNSVSDRHMVRAALDSRVEEIEKLYIAFPKSLLGIEGTLSATIEQWQKIRLAEGIELESTDDMLFLAQRAESFSDNKEMVYELATIPFDIRKQELMLIWHILAEDIAAEKQPALKGELNRIKRLERSTDRDIRLLEECSEQCDLLYNFDRKFNAGILNEEIRDVRTAISRKLMQILSRQKLVGRTCKYCGKELPWDYEYNVCSRCHDRIYERRRG